MFIGDGAAWIWNLADEYFPNAVEIVDYMHATSHLSNVAKIAFGETETDAIKAWVKATKPILSDGNITEVVARIRGLDTQNLEVSDRIEREARYFEKHAKRPQYKAFREKGYHTKLTRSVARGPRVLLAMLTAIRKLLIQLIWYQIGSNVIESACKHVVGQRCKQTSMRWEKPGINAVLG